MAFGVHLVWPVILIGNTFKILVKIFGKSLYNFLVWHRFFILSGCLRLAVKHPIFNSYCIKLHSFFSLFKGQAAAWCNTVSRKHQISRVFKKVWDALCRFGLIPFCNFDQFFVNRYCYILLHIYTPLCILLIRLSICIILLILYYCQPLRQTNIRQTSNTGKR